MAVSERSPTVGNSWRALPGTDAPSNDDGRPRGRPSKRRSGSGPSSDELDEHHLGRVGATRAELEDAGVATRPVGVGRRDLLEQLVHGELVLAQDRQGLTARVQVALLGERDELLDLGLDGLGLGLGRLDALVLDDLLAEVGQQRLAVGAVAAALVSGLLMAHGRRAPRS